MLLLQSCAYFRWLKNNFLLFRFAFIDFESVDDAKKSVKAMNGHSLDGRELKVDFAQERGSGESVFVLLLLCNSARHYL